jgi:hypothetical protein
VTSLEHQVAEIATTVTQTDEVAVREITKFKRAFVEHREEVRRALAETATRELVIRELSGLRAELRGELQSLRTELRGGLQSLQTEFGAKARDLQVGLDELRAVGDGPGARRSAPRRDHGTIREAIFRTARKLNS